MNKQKSNRGRPTGRRNKSRATAQIETRSRKFPPAVEQALERQAFGKYRAKTFRHVVETDLAWLHWIYRQKRAGEGVTRVTSPGDLAIMLLCKHFPLGLGDEAEKELEDAPAMIPLAAAPPAPPAPPAPAICRDATLMDIPAEIYSDDRRYTVEFDAEPWFAQATNAQLLSLAKDEFCLSEAADAVACSREMADPEIHNLLEYIRSVTARGERDVEYEVVIDSDRALRWIEKHRPHLLSACSGGKLSTTLHDYHVYAADSEEFLGVARAATPAEAAAMTSRMVRNTVNTVNAYDVYAVLHDDTGVMIPAATFQRFRRKAADADVVEPVEAGQTLLDEDVSDARQVPAPPEPTLAAPAAAGDGLLPEDTDKPTIERLRGCLAGGYTPLTGEAMLTALKQLTGLHLVTVWRSYRNRLFTGESVLAILSPGNNFFECPGNVHAFLFDPKSVVTLPKVSKNLTDLDAVKLVTAFDGRKPHRVTEHNYVWQLH